MGKFPCFINLQFLLACLFVGYVLLAMNMCCLKQIANDVVCGCFVIYVMKLTELLYKCY